MLGLQILMQGSYENQNSGFRNILRVIGFMILPIGVIFAAIGLIDFFAAFGGHGFPTKFWCVFVGFPLVGLGVACLKAGFLRAIGGYVASETAPVAVDTLKYVSHELRPTMRNIATDLHENSTDADPVTRMKYLEALKTSGLISEAEYTQKRTEILTKL